MQKKKTSKKQASQDQDQNNYKIIVAIKSVKEHSGTKHPNIKCSIEIQDKSKTVLIPFTEGQFFDLNNLTPEDTILLTFWVQDNKIGEISIPLTQNNIDNHESEIGDEIKLQYTYEGQEFKFQGNYYIIILNKQAYLEQNPPSKKSNKNVQFNDKKLNSPHKSTPPGKKSPSKKKNEIDTQLLQEQIEKSVKGAMSEMKKSQKLDDKYFQVSKDTQARARTIEKMEDSPTRISESVQLIKQSTSGDDARISPTRLATFNIDEDMSPKKKRDGSPSRHNDHYDHHCHENLTCLYYIDQANQSEELKIRNDYLKRIIYLMDQKLKAFGVASEYGERFQNELDRTEKARIELQSQLNERMNENKKLKELVDKQLNDALSDKGKISKDNIKLKDENDELRSSNKHLNNELQQQKLKNADLLQQIKDLKKQSEKYKEVQEKLAQAEKRESDNIQDYKHKLQQLDDLIDQANKQRRVQEQKINDLQNELIETQNKMGLQSIDMDELNKEIDRLQKNNQVLKQREGSQKVLNDQIQNLQNELAEKVKAKQQSDILNDQLKKQINQLNQQLIEKEKIINEKSKEIRKIQQHNNIQTQNLNDQITEKNKTIMQNKQDIKAALMANLITQDLQKQVEEERTRSNYYYKNQQNLQQQLQEQITFNQQQNKQMHDLQKKIRDLEEEIDTSQKYAQNLKQLIVEMQEKNIAYVPYHNDPIDKALSDFINSFYAPHMLSGLFIRENEGVYQFGTKKLYIKIEQNKILIRTGGGFIGIDEFLDLYTPAELEKMKRLSPEVIKKKNDNMNDNMEKNMKVIREIKPTQKTPLKPQSHGAVFSSPDQ